MRTIELFAAKDDLLPVIELVEAAGPLKYLRTGNFRVDTVTDELTVISSGQVLPHLGHADADSSSSCKSFLVVERDMPVNFRTLTDVNGRERVLVDQLVNPDSVVLSPGGIWDDAAIIGGRVGTAWDSPASQLLMKRFRAAIKKSFTKVRAFHVGPQAMALWNIGTRLTLAMQSPPEFDLAHST